MTTNPPTALIRTFRDLSDKEIAGIESAGLLSRWGMERGTTWDDLLKSQRILIVSEAGVGKTYECQTRRDRLWEGGEPAFFIELATLADYNVRNLLSTDELVRFDAWLASQSDTATFFLDSVDELKISQKSFEQALKRLNRAIAGHLGRARVVITTRPVAFDQALIQKHLPIPPAKESAASAEAFADVAMNVERRRSDQSNMPKTWRNVGLLPLARDDISAFAIGQGVVDPEALIADIEQRDAWDYTQRPMDLIELCVDWKEHHRIRNYGEQSATNAANKLKPRTDRPEKATLTLDHAVEGASRLALAALVTRKLTIRYSAESDKAGSSEAALDASKVLTNWPQPELDTLLERPLFGFANYGRVRFHHRSVIEYLAAKRLDALLNRGVPINAVKRLLFAETAQGEKVVRPSMRPIAAWLSLSHGTIFSEVRDREPDVLLTQGDPQSLSTTQRGEVLKTYVARYGKGGWRGLRVPAIQVRRFAARELSATVKSLWAEGIENPEVRELIFELIAAGRMEDCGDIAHDVLVDGTASPGDRLGALNILIAFNDPRLGAIASSIASDVNLWPADLARTASLRLFPKHLSVAPFIELLPRIQVPERAAGDLSWKLPQLIAEEPITANVLNELRTGLTRLVTEQVEWKQDKWPHTRTRRPDLVTSLIAACNRQFREGVTTKDLYTSAVLALRFTKDDHRSEEGVKELLQNLENAPSDRREEAFWADDEFSQSLHPATDPWHRLFHLSHYGGIRLNPDKDRAWVIKQLSDKATPRPEREMMLNAAMIELLRSGDDTHNVLEGLKAYVRDDASLLKIINNRMKPGPENAELQRLEKEHERRRKNSESKQAKARASWVKFWGEIASNPDGVFTEARADNTAWNLWQAMERLGQESRASGWNRRFIEQQFGRGVADRLRETLKRMWRKDKPTLGSERPSDKKSTFLVRWQLGLAAIYAEAEDPEWGEKLSEAEAELAARYAPIELNGFPAWLDALGAAHLKAVDSVLGEELSRSLAEPVEDNSPTISLQNIQHASPSAAALFLPRVQKWLEEIRGKGFQNNPTTERLVGQAVDLLMHVGTPEAKERLKAVASEELAKGLQAPFARVWLPVLLQLDPEKGVSTLEVGLKLAPVNQRGLGVTWISAVFGHDSRGAAIDLRRPEYHPTLLLRLIRLAYQHVRPRDDALHEGSYSSDERDHAEQGRNNLVNALLSATGPGAFSTKLEMAADPLFSHFKDHVIAVAKERAAEEVDGPALSEAQFLAFDRYGEVPPSTRDAMFDLMRDRLEDIDDLLIQEASPRATWALIKDETLMRREIAREMINKENNAYRVDQEAVTADEKKTDIRMLSTASSQKATIELKIGDKSRSAAELKATLKDQLVAKYMAAEDCRSGCLVITLAGDKTWHHPNTNRPLDFAGLIAMLNEEAKRLSQELGGSVRLMAKGYDLRPRLKTERKAKSKK